MCRDLYKMHNRAIGLYLTFLAAIGAGVVKLASDGSLARVLTLPWTFWLISFVLVAVVSGTAQIVLVRWWILSIEYTTAINGIRLAFVTSDPTLQEFLALPTTPWRASGRMFERAAFHLHFLVMGSASVILGAAVFRCAVSAEVLRPCAFTLAAMVGALWLSFSVGYRRCAARRSDNARR